MTMEAKMREDDTLKLMGRFECENDECHYAFCDDLDRDVSQVCAPFTRLCPLCGGVSRQTGEEYI
jgi:hypothetical protein